jgi:hypothetical protein
MSISVRFKVSIQIKRMTVCLKIDAHDDVFPAFQTRNTNHNSDGLRTHVAAHRNVNEIIKTLQGSVDQTTLDLSDSFESAAWNYATDVY